MKNSIRLLLFAALAGGTLSFNTSCTPTEAAIVGGLAGAAIGAAVADDRRGPRGRACGPGFGHGPGFGPGPGYVPRGGFGGPGWW